MISTALEEVSHWEALADWLDINSDTIRENCAISLDLGQCYRRELVKTYCDRLPSGDAYLVVEHMANVLEIEMKKYRQAQDLRDLHFPREFEHSITEHMADIADRHISCRAYGRCVRNSHGHKETSSSFVRSALREVYGNFLLCS